MPAAPVVGHRSQIGTRARGGEGLFHAGGAEAARRVEIRVDHVAVVPQDLSRRFAHGVPGLIRFHGNAQVDLIARVGIRIEPECLPPATVLDGKAAGDDGLGQDGRQLVGPPCPDFRRHDARDVALDIHAIHHGKTAAARGDAHAPAIAPAVRHHEPVLGDVHDGDAAQRVRARAIGLHQSEPRGIGRIGDDDPPHPGRNRSHRRAARRFADEQLATFGPADRGVGQPHREPNPQLGFSDRGRRRARCARARRGRE